jgi:hypothetical protein
MTKSYVNAEFAKPGRRGSSGSDGSVVDLGFLRGKRIVDAGIIRTDDSAYLAIDYEDGGKEMRSVFDYSDLGFWLEWRGEKGMESPEDTIRKKLRDIWWWLDRSRDAGTLSVSDDAMNRRYVFKEGDQEIVSLDCAELKRMGQNVYKHFGSTARDIPEILEQIRVWILE